MSEQVKIEGHCKCVERFYQPDRGGWCFLGMDGLVARTIGAYCPDCGYQLGKDGYAYKMVRADRATELDAELAEAKTDEEQARFIIEWLHEKIGPAMSANNVDCELDEVCEYLTDIIDQGKYMGIFKPETCDDAAAEGEESQCE